MHNLDIFVAKVCRKKKHLNVAILQNCIGTYTLKTRKRKISKWWDVKKDKAENSIWENLTNLWSIPSTCQTRTHLQPLIFNQASNTVIEMKNPEHFWWNLDGIRYIAIARDNPVAQDTVISFTSFNCEVNIFSCVCGVAIC